MDTEKKRHYTAYCIVCKDRVPLYNPVCSLDKWNHCYVKGTCKNNKKKPPHTVRSYLKCDNTVICNSASDTKESREKSHKNKTPSRKNKTPKKKKKSTKKETPKKKKPAKKGTPKKKKKPTKK